MKARRASAFTREEIGWRAYRRKRRAHQKIYGRSPHRLAFAVGAVKVPPTRSGKLQVNYAKCAPMAAILLTLTAVATTTTASAAPEGLHKAARAAAPHYQEDQALVDSINGAWRPTTDKVRDQFRHPLESLTFWGLQPGMTVVDLQPGGGYWTQILAPYALKTHGRYVAGVQDFADPKLSERAKKARVAFEGKFADKALYGEIAFVGFGPDSAPFAPPGTVDLVLTSRELHNWAPDGKLDKIMGDAYAALKPGGVLAVEDHRADPGPEAPKWTNGYIATQTVVDAAAKAGFRLDASSEVNANPADLKNYPFGVWTLPPSRQSAPDGQPADPNFSHAKYDAIGESDRMTLRFRKPG